MKSIVALISFGGWLALATPSTAQTYSIDWHKISGGGGTSTNDNFTLTGTIGQAGAGAKMSGGGFTVNSGFWGLVAVVQTPGAPTLSMRMTGTNAVVVSWPSSAAGFVLQKCSDLAVKDWVNAGMSVQDDGTTKSVVISHPTGQWYFRLESE
jgi:hypothetical protein